MSFSRYILPFMLVLLSGLMYVLYINPTVKDIFLLRDKKVDYENAINNAGEVRDLQARLLAEVEAIDQSDRDRLEKLLPASHDPVLLIYDLNTFAQRRGLAIKSPVVVTPPVDPKSASSPKVLPVRIKFSVSAPYSVFRMFMADLEHELALKDIKRLSIAGEENSALESSVFTYQIEIDAYSYQGMEKKKSTASVSQPAQDI